MLAYISFGLSLSWMRISNWERNIRKYLENISTERSETKQYPSNRLDLSENISCYNKDMEFSQVVSDQQSESYSCCSQGMRTKYWVLYNYIRAARQFNCDETITYTTQWRIGLLAIIMNIISKI